MLKNAVLTVLALSLPGPPTLAASPTISAQLAVQRSGNTLSTALTLDSRLAVPFRAAYACTLETFLVNAAGKVVQQHPLADVACPSTYFWLGMPANSCATVFRKTLPWKLSELPPGVYRIKARLLMFHVPTAFRTNKLLAWSATFTLPDR